MTQEAITLDSSLTELPRREWLSAVESIVDEDGHVENLGRRHHTILFEKSPILVVSFETFQGIQVLSEKGQPLGWDMVKSCNWSSLTLVSNGDTWFRDPAVYAYFDRLIDDGFFDEFETVLFYGAGPCAYAAAAYSVSAPGARVLAIQPQATLDPRITGWDDRFTDMRARDFTSRYGYAPDMLDAAHKAYVVYDPREQLDAMHAALFTRSNVDKLRMRFMGDALQTDLLEMGTWVPTLMAAAEDRLDTSTFARIFRRRRDYRPYLRNLLEHLEREERLDLVEALCANVSGRMQARRFALRLRQLRAAQNVEDAG